MVGKTSRAPADTSTHSTFSNVLGANQPNQPNFQASDPSSQPTSPAIDAPLQTHETQSISFLENTKQRLHGFFKPNKHLAYLANKHPTKAKNFIENNTNIGHGIFHGRSALEHALENGDLALAGTISAKWLQEINPEMQRTRAEEQRVQDLKENIIKPRLSAMISLAAGCGDVQSVTNLLKMNEQIWKNLSPTLTGEDYFNIFNKIIADFQLFSGEEVNAFTYTQGIQKNNAAILKLLLMPLIQSGEPAKVNIAKYFFKMPLSIESLPPDDARDLLYAYYKHCPPEVLGSENTIQPISKFLERSHISNAEFSTHFQDIATPTFKQLFQADHNHLQLPYFIRIFTLLSLVDPERSQDYLAKLSQTFVDSLYGGTIPYSQIKCSPFVRNHAIGNKIADKIIQDITTKVTTSPTETSSIATAKSVLRFCFESENMNKFFEFANSSLCRQVSAQDTAEILGGIQISTDKGSNIPFNMVELEKKNLDNTQMDAAITMLLRQSNCQLPFLLVLVKKHLCPRFFKYLSEKIRLQPSNSLGYIDYVIPKSNQTLLAHVAKKKDLAAIKILTEAGADIEKIGPIQDIDVFATCFKEGLRIGKTAPNVIDFLRRYTALSLDNSIGLRKFFKDLLKLDLSQPQALHVFVDACSDVGMNALVISKILLALTQDDQLKQERMDLIDYGRKHTELRDKAPHFFFSLMAKHDSEYEKQQIKRFGTPPSLGIVTQCIEIMEQNKVPSTTIIALMNLFDVDDKNASTSAVISEIASMTILTQCMEIMEQKELPNTTIIALMHLFNVDHKHFSAKAAISEIASMNPFQCNALKSLGPLFYPAGGMDMYYGNLINFIERWKRWIPHNLECSKETLPRMKKVVEKIYANNTAISPVQVFHTLTAILEEIHRDKDREIHLINALEKYAETQPLLSLKIIGHILSIAGSVAGIFLEGAPPAQVSAYLHKFLNELGKRKNLTPEQQNKITLIKREISQTLDWRKMADVRSNEFINHISSAIEQLSENQFFIIQGGWNGSWTLSFGHAMAYKVEVSEENHLLFHAYDTAGFDINITNDATGLRGPTRVTYNFGDVNQSKQFVAKKIGELLKYTMPTSDYTAHESFNPETFIRTWADSLGVSYTRSEGGINKLQTVGNCAWNCLMELLKDFLGEELYYILKDSIIAIAEENIMAINNIFSQQANGSPKPNVFYPSTSRLITEYSFSEEKSFEQLCHESFIKINNYRLKSIRFMDGW